jgi:predicted nucleotidyltransferase
MKRQKKSATNLSREEIITILKQELPRLKEQYGVERIVLYGSYAKGKQKNKSDIDVLVDLKETLGFEFFSLNDRLEEILGRKVDLATFDHYKSSFHNPRYKHIAEDIEKSLIYV